MSIMTEVRRIGRHMKNPVYLFKGKPIDATAGYTAEKSSYIISKKIRKGIIGLKGKL